MPDFLHRDNFQIWLDGGLVMVPLLLLALFIYILAMDLIFFLRRKDYRKIPETSWRKWIDQPEEGVGELGEIIRYSQDEASSMAHVQNRFGEIKLAEFSPIDRKLIFLTVLVTTAPLLGLLGTVFGMLTTFEGLSTGSGKVVEDVASGISQALITTETGLLIALPGYFLVYAIRRRRNQYEAFLARVESLTVQIFKRNERILQ